MVARLRILCWWWCCCCCNLEPEKQLFVAGGIAAAEAIVVGVVDVVEEYICVVKVDKQHVAVVVVAVVVEWSLYTQVVPTPCILQTVGC